MGGLLEAVMQAYLDALTELAVGDIDDAEGCLATQSQLSPAGVLLSNRLVGDGCCRRFQPTGGPGHDAASSRYGLWLLANHETGASPSPVHTRKFANGSCGFGEPWW